jgi:hypothetical protein
MRISGGIDLEGQKAILLILGLALIFALGVRLGSANVTEPHWILLRLRDLTLG